MRTYVALLALAACDSSSSASLNNADDFVRQSIQISCDFVVRCCGTAWATAMYGDPGGCLRMGLAASAQGTQMTDAQIAAGTVGFDAAAANACLDWMRTGLGACDAPISEAPSACRDAVHGLVPVGAACANLTNGAKCAPGLYCDSSTQCAALPTAGQACTLDYGCADGTVCLSSGRCGMPLAAGQPCAADLECQSDNCPYVTSNQVCSASPRVPDLASICK